MTSVQTLRGVVTGNKIALKDEFAGLEGRDVIVAVQPAASGRLEPTWGDDEDALEQMRIDRQCDWCTD